MKRVAAILGLIAMLGVSRSAFAEHGARVLGWRCHIEDVNALTRSVQPPGENSWPLYRAILRDELGMTTDDPQGGNALKKAIESSKLRRLLDGAWNDPRCAEQMAAYREGLQLLPMLDAAGEAPGYARDIFHGGDAISGERAQRGLLPLHEMREGGGAGAMRGLQNLNLVRMREASIEGDWDEVMRRVRTGLRCAAHRTHQAWLLDWLLAAGEMSRVADEVGVIVVEQRIPPAACEAMLAEFERQPWPATPLTHMLSAAEIAAYDAMEWFYGPGDRSVGQWASSEDMPPAWLGWLQFELSRLGLRVWWTRAAPYYGPKPISSLIERGNAVIRTFLGLMPVARREIDRAMSERSAAMVMLRLERFEAEHGRWPESVKEAMTRAEATDAASGKPFEYAVLTPGGATPYSLRRPWWKWQDEREMCEARRPLREDEPE